MLHLRRIALACLVLGLAACAGSREIAVHPLTGSWDYELDSPEGLIKGVLVVNEIDGALSGSLTNESGPVLSIEIAELLFDSETSEVDFSFATDEYGKIIVNLKLTGDVIEGILTASDLGVDVPMVGQRSVEAEE